MGFTDEQMRASFAQHQPQNLDADSLFYAVCLDVLGYTPLGQIVTDMTEFDAFEARYRQLFESQPKKTYIKITFNHGGFCVCDPKDVADMTAGAEAGYKTEEVLMTEQEFEALPEFDG